MFCLCLAALNRNALAQTVFHSGYTTPLRVHADMEALLLTPWSGRPRHYSLILAVLCAGSCRHWHPILDTHAIHDEVRPRCPTLFCPVVPKHPILPDMTHRPFWDHRLDYLDCSCCITILLHVLSGFYYNSLNFAESEAAMQLDRALVAFTLLTLAAIIGLILSQALELEFKISATASVSRAVAASIASFQNALCRGGNRGALMGLLDQLADAEELKEGVSVVHPRHGSGRIKDVVTMDNRQKAGSVFFVVQFESGEQRCYSEMSAKKLSIVAQDRSTMDMVKLAAFRTAVVTLCTSHEDGAANAEASSHLAEAVYLVLKVVAGDSDLSAARDKGVPKTLVPHSLPAPSRAQHARLACAGKRALSAHSVHANVQGCAFRSLLHVLRRPKRSSVRSVSDIRTLRLVRAGPACVFGLGGQAQSTVSIRRPSRSRLGYEIDSGSE
jgi:hypothetical protein